MQRSLNIRSGALLRLRYLESVQRLRHATCTQNSPMPFSEIPKIPSLSFIGSAWMYLPLIGRYNIRDGSRAAWDIYQRYGPIVAQHLPGRRVIVRLFSANDIRTLYQEEGKTPHHVGSLALKLYHQSRKPKFFANDGLLHSKGDEWRRIRSLSHNSVSAPNTVQEYADGIAGIVDDVISLISLSRDDNREVQDCHILMKRWASESAIFLVMGKRVGILEHTMETNSLAGNMFFKIEDIFFLLNELTTTFPYHLYIPTPSWRRFVRHNDEVVSILLPFITEAAESALRDPSKQNITLVTSLLHEAKMTFKEIFTFAFDFIVAGSETVAAAATYCLYCLAMNPLVQQKAREEVQSVLNSDASCEFKYWELPYVKACIRESLRLYPIVPGVHRKLDHDVVMSGYLIPRNTILRTEIFVSGRLEENFTRASEFIPERWLRANGGRAGEALKNWALHPFASLPFSTGVRMCIGRRIAEMELSILIAKVLKEFRVENHHGDIGFLSQMTSRPQKAPRFRFIKLE
ncbi:probable cytochrome P450 301a1, mitochondrial [Rhipicephalus sanguineus]|uniref:probable cytochrome P450 301a1, mitochondrial n=1 Tax=Rhipicephalus sanguineus TaxID=34632 RepID=UPI0018934E5F|nr:probable cytochrome P450 301a1, mitochondrial [Rhipicephalus sanguineus]